MTDLFLFNGFSPLRRAAGDVFLDNGIGLLRTYLEKNGIDFEIEDPYSIEFFEQFNIPAINTPLRNNIKNIYFSNDSINESERIKQEAIHLYFSMLSFHEDKMNTYLNVLVDRICNQNIPVVGIKLWIGNIYKYCERFCNLLNDRSPETVVVVGGPQPNCLHTDGLILKYSPFDLAVYSDGEVALTKIVNICKIYQNKRDRLNAIVNSNIPNLIYRFNNEIFVNPPEYFDINNKVIPTYNNLLKKLPVHTVMDTLGCDYGHCNYCVHPLVYKQHRLRDPRLIVEEFKIMLKQNIGLFTMTASDTPLPHAYAIGKEILSQKLKLEYYMLTRACHSSSSNEYDIISMIRILIRSGLKMVFIGVESANDEVLVNVMNKGLSVKDIIFTIDCIRKASELEKKHVYIVTSYIYPTPLTDDLVNAGISNASLFDENLSLIKRTRPDSFVVTPGLLYPGTEWYNNPHKFNITIENEDFIKNWNSIDISFHSFINPPNIALYSFLGKSIREWIQESIALSRAGNSMGIPSDMMDDQIILASAAGYENANDLINLSKDIFLDLVTCNDVNTRILYDNVRNKSKDIAAGNSHIGK